MRWGTNGETKNRPTAEDSHSYCVLQCTDRQVGQESSLDLPDLGRATIPQRCLWNLQVGAGAHRHSCLALQYNQERQETFAEDMELLAEGSEEDRVVQKYQSDGVWHGCFPHFEDHNSLERRGAPTLPFPPGVEPPVSRSKPKPEIENELELERDPGLPRLTEVNRGKPTNQVPESLPPVQSVQDKKRPASPAFVPCKCGLAKPGKPCFYCNATPVAVPANGQPKPPARPAQPKKLGFDPHDLNEPIGGYTAEQVSQIVRFHWDESDKPFWRDTCHSREFFERNIEKMANAIPAAWLNPKKIVKKKNGFMHGNWG